MSDANIYLLCAHGEYDDEKPTRYMCASFSHDVIAQEQARYTTAAEAIDQQIEAIQDRIALLERKRMVRYPTHSEFYEAGQRGLPPPTPPEGFTLEDQREVDRLYAEIQPIRTSGIDPLYDDTTYFIEVVPFLAAEPTP